MWAIPLQESIHSSYKVNVHFRNDSIKLLNITEVSTVVIFRIHVITINCAQMMFIHQHDNYHQHKHQYFNSITS